MNVTHAIANRESCNILVISLMRMLCCRDRLIGLLTERASRTLLYYLSETNQHVYHWLIIYIRENPIPRVQLASIVACVIS